MKKRLSECINNLFDTDFKPEHLRLWQVSTDGCAVKDAVSKVQQSLKNDMPMQESTARDDQIEENTGIECPGDKHLEAYIGSLMTVEDNSFLNECLLVEASEGSFAFKYCKQERAYFGKCEWCIKNKQLTVVCKCKRVRYCNADCQ